MSAVILVIAAINGFLVVSIGAFGAHGLQARLQETGYLATFETGVQYHMFHTIALLGLALLAMQAPESRLLSSAAWLFLAGIILFSGSLYVLAISGISWLGAITPLGGLGFLAGWGCLIWFAASSSA
jgi:uncharacterized membrane protein YgdD (TMEM256/DUF423 family)